MQVYLPHLVRLEPSAPSMFANCIARNETASKMRIYLHFFPLTPVPVLVETLIYSVMPKLEAC